MIGATPETWTKGRHLVTIRRDDTCPYVNMPIIVVREASLAEYLDYCRSEGAPFQSSRGTGPPLLRDLGRLMLDNLLAGLEALILLAAIGIQIVGAIRISGKP